MPTYMITETGFRIIGSDGSILVDQPFDPRSEGFEPIPESDREYLAKGALMRVIQMMPMPRPVLHVEQRPVGPDAGSARIDGFDMRVTFRPGPDGNSQNGIGATVTVSVMGHVLNGEDGFPSMDDTFGMPFQPVDFSDAPSGPAIIRAITFVKGVAEITFFPPQPNTYVVTEESINRRLPESKHLQLSTPIRVQGELR